MRHAAAAILFLLGSTAATQKNQAGPWVNPGDETLRHHIQVLSDAGVIKVPVTTWPLMWSGIKADLEANHIASLTDAQQLSANYVLFALRRDTNQGIRKTWRGNLRETPNTFTNFSDNSRDKSETSVSADWMSNSFASRIEISYSDDANNDSNLQLDGTHLSAILGNWALTAGSIDRWWGPSWQNNLILGTNARPTPSLTLQRNYPAAPKSRWLSWIGPWHMETFMAQLESNRHVSNALLWGFRFSLKPLSALEVGLTRTAQWGGEGRPQNLSTFIDLLAGRDNRGDNGLNQSNEPGNQLGGIDWRISSTFFEDTGVGLYGQWIGEDESGALPSRFTILMGIDASIINESSHHRIYLEYSDTTTEGFKGESKALPNYAYEHAVYQNGYRYRNRAIGSATDNDSRMLTFAHNIFVRDDRQINWSLSRVELNRDGTNRPPPGGNTLARSSSADLWVIDVAFSILFDPLKFTVGVNHLSNELIYFEEKQGGTSAHIAWEARW